MTVINTFFVGRQRELRILSERLAAAEAGRPHVVYLEGAPGGGKSTLLSEFLGSLSGAVILQAAGDEAETLLSYGVIDQLQPVTLTEPLPMTTRSARTPRTDCSTA